MTDQGEPLARIADALERLCPPVPAATDWLGQPAYVLARESVRAVERFDAPSLDLLRGIDEQKARVVANVLRLAQGHAAHDMLLWGARGMGKSALLRSATAFAQAEHPGSIALVQVAQNALAGLSDLFGTLGGQERRFLVFVDDLGFEDEDGAGPRLLRSRLRGMEPVS